MVGRVQNLSSDLATLSHFGCKMATPFHTTSHHVPKLKTSTPITLQTTTWPTHLPHHMGGRADHPTNNVGTTT